MLQLGACEALANRSNERYCVLVRKRRREDKAKETAVTIEDFTSVILVTGSGYKSDINSSPTKINEIATADLN